MPTTPTDIQVPASVPNLPGAAISARYLLTDLAPINRGDTLDAFGTPDGRVVVVVADVVGTGFPAAIAATQLRTVLRASLLEGADLAEAVVGLDRLAASVPALETARLAVAVLDPAAARVEYVAAGHPPPVLCPPVGAAHALTGSYGRPLGSNRSGAGRVKTAVTGFAEGSALLLHTDGLTSGGAVAPDDVGAVLARDLAACIDLRTPYDRGDEAVERLLREAVPPAAYVDDVAVVLLQGAPAVPRLRLDLAAVGGEVATVRTEVSQWLEDAGAGLGDQVALAHAAGELARNVVNHAYAGGPPAPGVGGLRVEAHVDAAGRAVVVVADDGRWRSTTDADGQGLVMASGLVDELLVRRTAAGTEVELRQELCRPVPLLAVNADVATSGPVAVDDDLRTEVAPGVLVASGVVDDVSIETFDSALREATRAGTLDAVVDLTGLTLLGSPGLRSLLRILRLGERSGAEVRVVARADSAAARVLDLVDVDHTG